MEEIKNLNRDRNTAIIRQAKELNDLLIKNDRTPIFLKGVGNLFANLYEDIAERMLGDTDFIFSEENYPKPIAILYKNGYERTVKSKIKIDYADLVFNSHHPKLADQKINKYLKLIGRRVLYKEAEVLERMGHAA